MMIISYSIDRYEAPQYLILNYSLLTAISSGGEQPLGSVLKLFIVIAVLLCSISDQHVVIKVDGAAVVYSISESFRQFVRASIAWQSQLKKACLCSRKTVGLLGRE